MGLTLLGICTRALDGIGSLVVPDFIVGNEDDTARQLLALAKEVGEELNRDYTWPDNLRDGTVTTTADDALYPLEDDYDGLVSDTMWESGNLRPMRGAVTSRHWAALTNVAGVADNFYRWRVYRRQIQITPTPASAFTFTYQYLSNVYCTDSALADRADGWANDTDLPVLPFDLHVAGLRYRFLAANNLPYGDAEAAFEAVIEKRLARESPAAAVDMADAVPPLRGQLSRLNIPETVDYS